MTAAAAEQLGTWAERSGAEFVRGAEGGEKIDFAVGLLGSDNVYFTLVDLPLRLSYSYESNIHLSYAREDDIVTQIRERWLSEGWLTESIRSKNYNR